MSSDAGSLAHEPCFKLGRVMVEPSLRVIRSPGGTELQVEPRVMQVLVALAKSTTGLLSRSDLRDACWDGRATSDDAIDRVIAQIRRLGSAAGNAFTVETVPKVGYRLVGPGIREDTGETALDGFSRRWLLGGTAAALAVLAGATAFYRRRLRPNVKPDGAPFTIAVLPFTPETPSPALAAIAATLSDDVRSDVSRVSDVRVIARISSRKVADERLSAQQIRSSLGTDYVVEGEVGEANGQIVSRVALVDTADGAQVWAAKETVPLGDPTGLRNAISGDVIQNLAGIIPISVQQATPTVRPDPQAYALVQQANNLLENGRTLAMRGRQADTLALGSQAEQLAHRALVIDPNDGGALAVLATIARNGWTPALARENLTTEQRIQASIIIIRRALVADPRNPAALTELGDYYRRFEFRWTEAENLFLRALKIDRSFVDAHWSYAYELGTLGRALEGLDHALSVFELDPRNPYRRIALPRLLYLVGDRDGAIRRYKIEVQQQPDNLFLLRELYFMFLAEGSVPALQSLRALIDQSWGQRSKTPELVDLSDRILAAELALTGKPERLRKMIDDEVRSFDRADAVPNATSQGRARDDLPFIFAIEYAWAGLPEKSVDMLDRALAGKSLYWPASLPYGITQFPQAVRQNPRYVALWERDPGLRYLLKSRRASILAGRIAGFTPDGRKIVPSIPNTLRQRVDEALKRQA